MDRNSTRKILTNSLIGIFVLFVLVYTGFEIKKYATGPKLLITNPENGIVLSSSLLEIQGTAINVKQVTINDQPVFMDEQGNFKEKTLLSYGYNVIKIEGVDKFGRQTRKDLELIYK